MRINLYPLVVLLAVLSMVGAANARPITSEDISYVESRVRVLNNDTYFINWSETGEELTRVGGYLGLRRVKNWTFWLTEMDPHIAQYIRVIDYETISIMIVENPDDPNPTPDLPLHACVNGTTIKRGNRFERAHDWCDGDKEYFLERIPMNRWWIIQFDAHPTYEWWLGEGQGGGGNGIPLCEDIGVGLSVNDTSGVMPLLVKETASVTYQGSTSAGCTVSSLRFEFKDSTTGNIWRTIPTNPDPKSMDCKGVSCNLRISSFGSYVRNTRCADENLTGLNTSLRAVLIGVVLSNPVTKYSIPRSLECKAPPAEADACTPPVSAPFVMTENCTYVDEVVSVYQYVAIPPNVWFALLNASLVFLG